MPLHWPRRPRRHRSRALLKWQQEIDDCGWIVVHVPDHDPAPLHYTAGLTEMGLQEVFTFGLVDEQGGLILNDVAERLIAGWDPPDQVVISDLLEREFDLQLWTVSPAAGPPLGIAWALYGDSLRHSQLVTPDEHNCMPWDPEYQDEPQPLFFTPPRPT